MFDILSKHPPTDNRQAEPGRQHRFVSAESPVTATLASSIESTIEELVSRILAEYVEKAPDTETP
jgi:hypothetical protein